MAVYWQKQQPLTVPSLTPQQRISFLRALNLIKAGTKKKKSVKKKKPTMMNIDELRVQIAIGTLKDPKAIAEVVKNCNDPKIILWASRHGRANVRVEAAKKKCLPFGIVMRLVFLDKAKTVKTAAAHSLGKVHFEKLLNLLEHIEDFPQTSLPFSETVRKIDYTVIDGPSEYRGQDVADAVQVARQTYECHQARQEVVEDMDIEEVDLVGIEEDSPF